MLLSLLYLGLMLPTILARLDDLTFFFIITITVAAPIFDRGIPPDTRISATTSHVTVTHITHLTVMDPVGPKTVQRGPQPAQTIFGGGVMLV